jgi:hypothetical protein
VGAILAAMLLLSACGTSDDDAARKTALRFFDSMSAGKSAECDETTADYLFLCLGRAGSKHRAPFKDPEITSVHTSREVLGAPANPVAVVTARVLGGPVNLRLSKPTDADWRVEQVVTHFTGHFAAENLDRPEPSQRRYIAP